MDILSIIITFLSLTFFGLLIAFNPLLLVSQMAIILKSKRPVYNGLVFSLGVISPIILLAILGELFLTNEPAIFATDIRLHLNPRVDILLGLVLFFIAVRMVLSLKLNKPKPKKPNRSIEAIEQVSSSPAYLFIFAFLRSALSATSIVGVLASVKAMKEFTDNPIVIVIGLMWTLLIGVSPFLALIGFSIKKPDSVKSIQDQIDPFVNKNYQPLIICLCFLFSVYFLYIGLF